MSDNATPSDVSTHLCGLTVLRCMLGMLRCTGDGDILSCIHVALLPSDDTEHPTLHLTATSGMALVIHRFGDQAHEPKRRDPLALDLQPGWDQGIMLRFDPRMHLPALKSIIKAATAKKRPKSEIYDWRLTDAGFRVMGEDIDVSVPAVVAEIENSDKQKVRRHYPDVRPSEWQICARGGEPVSDYVIDDADLGAVSAAMGLAGARAVTQHHVVKGRTYLSHRSPTTIYDSIARGLVCHIAI